MKRRRHSGPVPRVLIALFLGRLMVLSEGCVASTTRKINRNTKTVAVADGGGNLDNEVNANETWGAGYVLFSKTGHGKEVKPG
jgi:hypothetical protein